MRLISLKTCKVPAIVICMLAAGICYSCGGHPDPSVGSGYEGIVLELGDSGSGQDGLGNPGSGKDEPGDSGSGKDESGNPGFGKDESGRPDSGQDGLGKLDSGQSDPGRGDSAQSPAAMVYVHVCGMVEQPGVYGLPEGSRVYEAVEAAGGIRDGGAADYLNLAETLKDGMKLEVPSESQAEEWKAQGIKPAADPEAKARHMVNLNTATREELMSLRGIGESRAEDIIRYRETYGGFQSIEDIMNVSGIKDAAFEKIKDSITV